jgi:hypothetical protein
MDEWHNWDWVYFNLHVSFGHEFKKLKIMPCVEFEAWLGGRKKRMRVKGGWKEKLSEIPKILWHGLLSTINSICWSDPLSLHSLHCPWAIKELFTTGNLIRQTRGPGEEQAGSLQLVKSSQSPAWEIALQIYQSCLHFAVPKRERPGLVGFLAKLFGPEPP